MPRSDPEIVAIVAWLMIEAKAGRLRDLYVLWRDDAGDYGSDYCTEDLPDLLFELSTEIIKERSAGVEPSRQ